MVYYDLQPQGGHFAAWEKPELFVNEMRAGFGTLRLTQGAASSH